VPGIAWTGLFVLVQLRNADQSSASMPDSLETAGIAVPGLMEGKVEKFSLKLKHSCG
jgi:hypothetical protein